MLSDRFPRCLKEFPCQVYMNSVCTRRVHFPCPAVNLDQTFGYKKFPTPLARAACFILWLRVFPPPTKTLKIPTQYSSAGALANFFSSRVVSNMEHRTTIQCLPLSAVSLLDLMSHTYLQHCSCRCYIILLLFCNEKPTSSSSQPLLLHLLANKGLHYLQLHGSHQLQNCRYCNTQNTLKRNKRNNYRCKTP